MSPAAWAFHDEPNDTAATADDIDMAVYGRGELDTSDTADFFAFFAHGDADLTVRLREIDANGGGLTLQLLDSSETVLATATEDGAGLNLTDAVEDGEDYFIKLTGSGTTSSGSDAVQVAIAGVGALIDSISDTSLVVTVSRMSWTASSRSSWTVPAAMAPRSPSMGARRPPIWTTASTCSTCWCSRAMSMGWTC